MRSVGQHPRQVALTLGLTGLYDRFAGRIYSVEDVNRAKPAPDLFLYAAADMNTRTEHCVVTSIGKVAKPVLRERISSPA